MATFGSSAPVILLHGGLGHSGNWGYQIPGLVSAGYRALVIDSRGHGRSTRDSRLHSYELQGSDVAAVMDALGLARAALVGWSDGACTALILAMRSPERVPGVFFFVCNMDLTGVKEFVETPASARCFQRHVKDYAHLEQHLARLAADEEEAAAARRERAALLLRPRRRVPTARR